MNRIAYWKWAILVVVALIATSCSDAASTTASIEPSTTAPTPATSAPATTLPASAAAVFTSYDLAPGLIDGRPTKVQGLLGVPEGPGPFPVALVMHGAHPPCVDDFIAEFFSPTVVSETIESLCGSQFPEYVRNDVGLGHIVTALNNVGIAAVSIDVSSTYVWWGGEPDEQLTLADTVSTHFDIVTSLNAGEDLGLGLEPLLGRFDLDDVSIVGHSRSGGYVASFLESTSTLPFEPSGAVMIEPLTGFPGTDHTDVPILLIRGGCDEDVGPDAGRQYLLDVLALDYASPVADLFIPSAGHRMLNTGLMGSSCPGEGDRVAIQAQAAQATASFLASGGQEVAVVDGVGATIEALRGSAPTSTTGAPMVDFDPQTVPEATSQSEVLPPWPEGADYSDALIEDF